MPLHVAIIGSRTYPDFELVKRHVAALARKYPDAIVVSGGCKGPDLVAEIKAHNIGLQVVSFRPRQGKDGAWYIDRYERAQVVSSELTQCTSFGQAAFYRNGLIAKLADVVLAYPSNPGRGTRATMRKAEALGRKVYANPAA